MRFKYIMKGFPLSSILNLGSCLESVFSPNYWAKRHFQDTTPIGYNLAMKNQSVFEIAKFAEHNLMKADVYYGHGTDNAWDEAVTLVLDALDLPHDISDEQAQQELSQEQVNHVNELLEKRINQNIPTPYLTHKAWFAGLEFYVDERVHIPRSPFAEWIIKRFEPWLESSNVTRILDLCTGSGSIAIACAHYFPNAKVDAVELDDGAAIVAQNNIDKHNLNDRVKLLKGNLWQPVKEKYDLIISNPPYVCTQEMTTLPKEFTHEPTMALEAGSKGLDIVDQILKNAKNYLNNDGVLAVEVGNTAAIMEKNYPKLPFMWLECEWGGDGVFILNKENL